jgi:CelD/BcsL family acetyltransferase involved in cellulose biosynthesis
MKISVVRPHELGGAELAAWRAMQQSNDELLSPFLSPGFALAAARVRPRARVAVLEEGQDLVGFLAFEQGQLRTGRPIAAGASNCQALIHRPGLEWNTSELLAGCHLDVWEFDHLVAGQITLTGQHIIRHSSPIIDVSCGYGSYLSERQRASKKVFRSTFYKLRKLERDIGQTRFEFDIQDRDAFRELLRWKSAQYRRSGRRDRLAGGWRERLLWDLFETGSDGCVGTLSVLYCGERVVAAHFGLRSDSSLACWFPAYDPSLGRYSPGLSLHLKMAEAAPTAGLRFLDLGKGDEPYKQSLKNDDLTVGEGWIDLPSVAAVMQRARRTPGRFASNLILNHPPLRRAARRVLKLVGSVRASI